MNILIYFLLLTFLKSASSVADVTECAADSTLSDCTVKTYPLRWQYRGCAPPSFLPHFAPPLQHKVLNEANPDECSKYNKYSLA